VEEKEDEDMWEPWEKRKDNKHKNNSAEHLKHTPQGKSSQLDVGEKTAKQKKKNKKISLEVENPKSKDSKENIVERLIAKNGSKYLVKWVNQPEDENTWEQKSIIPKHFLKVRHIQTTLISIFVFQYYERDLSRLGSLPPKLKSDLF